jgi:predicted pyridoxine 5'-phosphate oxidase superfamily flavin-nucleotide-binding protein
MSDVMFSPSVRAVQSRRGSARHFAERTDWPDRVTPELAEFVAAQTSFFLATASADGQPYVQHRGGPPGFLRVLDPQTLAFADFRGNRQFITLGNLAENPKAFLFLMDYAQRRRIKLWGEARVVEDDPALLESLRVEGYAGHPEQAIVFRLRVWDANCPQHIPQRFEAREVAAALALRDRRIAALEEEVARLTLAALGGAGG